MFLLRDRESGEELFRSGDKLNCLRAAEAHIKANPDRTIIMDVQCEDRVWKCKTTGNIRTDKHEDLTTHLKENQELLDRFDKAMERFTKKHE